MDYPHLVMGASEIDVDGEGDDSPSDRVPEHGCIRDSLETRSDGEENIMIVSRKFLGYL